LEQADALGLLIFKNRQSAPSQSAAQVPAPKPTPAPAPTPMAAPTPAPKPAPSAPIPTPTFQPHITTQQTAAPAAAGKQRSPEQYLPPEINKAPAPTRTPRPANMELLDYFPDRKSKAANDIIRGGYLTEAESLKFAKGRFCENHPWRQAYALCNVCKLPYCYIEIMEDHGKLYCLNDIDLAIDTTSSQVNPALNAFSMVSSAIFLGNSAVLGYFMYPQANYLYHNAVKVGALKFLLHVSSVYYLPLANVLLAILGVVAAVTVLRRSVYGFAFSMTVAFAGLMLILFEYLSSSVPYLFVSSGLLLLSLACLTYSRMSSAKEVVEDNVLIPDVEWPRPEVF
jgi:hypothetical protein